MVRACWVNKIHMQLLTLECPRESFWLLQKIMYTFSNSIIFLGYHSLVNFNINMYIFICYRQNLPNFFFRIQWVFILKRPLGVPANLRLHHEFKCQIFSKLHLLTHSYCGTEIKKFKNTRIEMFSKAKNRYYAARSGFMNNSWSLCERCNTDFWPLSISRFLEEEKSIAIDFIDSSLLASKPS